MLRRLSAISYIWSRVYVLLRKSAPLLSVAVAIVTVLEALAGIAILYVIKLLVDTITVELSAQSAAPQSSIILMLGITGAALVAVAFLQNLANILRMRQGLLVIDHVDREIHDRAISIDMRYYESPVYYDMMERARHGGAGRPAQIVSSAVTMLRAVLTLTAILVLIASIEPRLIVILILPICVALMVRLYFTRKLFEWRMSRAQKDRRARYLDWLMTNAAHAKDLRLSRIGSYLRDQYRDIRKDIREGEIRIEQTRLYTDFAFAVLGALVFVGAGAWLLQQALTQGRPIGDVVLFVLLLRRAEMSGKEFVGNTSKIVDDHLYLRRLFDFLEVEPSIKIPDVPEPVPNEIKSGLSMSNVSFRYDEAPSLALNDVTIEIRAGQVVALVGENGSGKTTLIKLLTRLYDPSCGQITLDGIDIREFHPEKYRKLISVIFQDYSTYAETVEDNIRFGDVGMPLDSARVRNAARTSGADGFIKQLPKGYQTPLTKLFDNGHDLSIGQWQRLALARAFYPDSKMIILDEPTSAVDPKAEFELFENFKSRLEGRSALIISHRLSTIRQADYTYVLEHGKVVEHGSHDQLISNAGKYADLFEKQGRHYK